MPRPRAFRALALAGSIVLLGGCGGSDDPTVDGGGDAGCGPAGDRLVISADDLKFDRKCLVAPANRPVAIVFSNKEKLPHDIDILMGDSASDRVFDGEIFSGKKTVTYQVPPLAPGSYSFRCAVHPAQMKGTFLVR